MSANSARQALETLLPRSGRVLVQGCSAESALLADAAADLGDRLGALVYTGVRVPGFNTRSWLPSAGSRFETFFMTPELAARRQQVDFLPLCYTDILRRLRNLPIAAALFSVSPPDDNGDCSFGPAVDFLAELWPQIPVRIAHVNPLLPRTSGPTIPLKALSAAVEAPEPLMTMGEEAADPRTAAIAQHVAGFIADGATLQTGLGKLPGAILRALSGLRSLRVHSGLIGDAALDLLEGGAIADGAHITAGVAIGSQRLYDALPDSGIRFCPVSVTHAPGVIATLPNFVAINSVMSVDLFGQGYSEAGPRGWNSGTGGATDFARGAGRRWPAHRGASGGRRRQQPNRGARRRPRPGHAWPHRYRHRRHRARRGGPAPARPRRARRRARRHRIARTSGIPRPRLARRARTLLRR